MTWLRWDMDTPEADLVDTLATALDLHPMRALGHYFAMVCGLGRHGEWNLADVVDARLERLARWDGVPGAWAQTVRARCQDADGMLRGAWRQQKLIAKRERDRQLARDAYRRTKGPDLETSPQKEPPSRDNRARNGRVSRESDPVRGTYTDVTDVTYEQQLHDERARALATTTPGTAVAPRERSAKVARNVEAVREQVAAVLAELATEGVERVGVKRARQVAGEMAFLYWQHLYGHPRAMLDGKRLKVALARLEENGGNVDELLYALDGARRDEYVMGQGRHAQAHDAFEFILRDRSAVEGHANRVAKWREGVPHPKGKKLAEAMRSPEEGPHE